MSSVAGRVASFDSIEAVVARLRARGAHITAVGAERLGGPDAWAALLNVRACVRACMAACVHACVRACVDKSRWCASSPFDSTRAQADLRDVGEAVLPRDVRDLAEVRVPRQLF